MEFRQRAGKKAHVLYLNGLGSDLVKISNGLQTMIITTTKLGSVDNSSSDRRRSAACPRDPENLSHTTIYCSDLTRPGSHGKAKGRRNLNCQQPLDVALFIWTKT